MDASQYVIAADQVSQLPLLQADLLFCFGSGQALQEAIDHGLSRRCPDARVVGCTTAGQIAGESIFDQRLSISALRFDHSRVTLVSEPIDGSDDSRTAGQRLIAQLPLGDLRHVLIISEGLAINGSELARGITESLPAGIFATGGMAADGDRFAQTGVLVDDQLHSNTVVAIGLYGHKLSVGFGSNGGWTPFGPRRQVTKAKGSVLFELDEQPALELYRHYLGDAYASALPASALRFPLLLEQHRSGGVVRSVLAVDEAAQSVTFAGDIPQGARVRLMRADFDHLIEGAALAAEDAHHHEQTSPDFALTLSCVGRRMVLQQRCEEELESVREILGRDAVMAGFYGYGEFSPLFTEGGCGLHNQTMTITALSEQA